MKFEIAPGMQTQIENRKKISVMGMKIKSIVAVAVFFQMLASPSVQAQNSAQPAKKVTEEKINVKPDLGDLGFKSEELHVNLQEKADLEERTWKLKTHQIAGLTTVGLMVGTALAAEEGKVPALHKNLAILTGIGYATTAYLSLSAPEIKKENRGWNLTAHKALAWVHMPAMILTIISGIQAERQIERGEKYSGLAKYKTDLAMTTLASFGLAATTMFFEF